MNEVADQAFNAFDPEKSGFISFVEFLVSYALTSHGDMRRKLEYAYELYDSQRTGSLQKDDVLNVLNFVCDLLGARTRQGKNQQDLIDAAVREIQFDSDGKVTKGKQIILILQLN